jgi:hypothetical protein
VSLGADGRSAQRVDADPITPWLCAKIIMKSHVTIIRLVLYSMAGERRMSRRERLAWFRVAAVFLRYGYARMGAKGANEGAKRDIPGTHSG